MFKGIEREIERLTEICNELERKGVKENKELVNKVNPFYGLGMSCRMNHGSYQFTYNNLYVPKNQMVEKVTPILQSRYEAVLLSTAKMQAEKLKMLMAAAKENVVDDLYDNMYGGYKKLVTPVYDTQSIFLKSFESEEYESLGFEEGISAEIYTNKGERVRSKSEKIIADRLAMRGIPYRYERPLPVIVKGNVRIFYPDFTIYVMSLRRLVYLEHFGLIDNQAYMQNAISKIEVYEKNGLIIGRDVFISHESASVPINTKLIDEYIDNFFV